MGFLIMTLQCLDLTVCMLNVFSTKLLQLLNPHSLHLFPSMHLPPQNSLEILRTTFLTTPYNSLELLPLGLLFPLSLLANTLLLQQEEGSPYRSLLCGVVIHARFTNTFIAIFSCFFSILFRTIVILHSDKGLVHQGKTNLDLFHKLFWIILCSFILMGHAIFPISHMIKRIYPEGFKNGKMCLLLPMEGDSEFLKEGRKLRMLNLMVPFLLMLCIKLLSLKVELFLNRFCPNGKMSCIGVYRRNEITYQQTFRLLFVWICCIFLIALQTFLVDENRGWSEQFIFHTWNIKGFITELINPILALVLFQYPPTQNVKSSNSEFYVRKPNHLEPFRPQNRYLVPICVEECSNSRTC